MIDFCSITAEPLLTVLEALTNIKNSILPVSGAEHLPIEKALGRVLAAAVYSPCDLPRAANAAMDGYALCSSDLNPNQATALPVQGTSWAGRPFESDLHPGHCLRIFTGAVVPAFADTVVMQEHVQLIDNSVVFPPHSHAYANIRAIGEDLKQGDLLGTAGKQLTALDLALFAAAGVTDVPVYRQVTVTLFSTGDELVALGLPLAAGQIYDSNQYLLNALLTDPYLKVQDGGVLSDNPDVIQQRFFEAAQSDVIISTGGVSVGEADHVKAVLENLGSINFWKLAIKPGKPLTFGKLGSSYFFGLPGNPMAVLVTYQQFVLPALRQLAGTCAQQPLRIQATCMSALKKLPGRVEFQRGILQQTDSGEFQVESAGLQGSHILISASRANCFIVLPADCKGIAAGEQIWVEPFTAYL